MSSDPNDIRITQYIFNELDEADKVAFEAEMEKNSQLRKLVDQTRDTVASLQSDFQAEPVVGLTDEQREKIEAGIETSDTADVTPATAAAGRPLKNILGPLALAASLLLIVSLTLFKPWNQPGRELADTATDGTVDQISDEAASQTAGKGRRQSHSNSDDAVDTALGSITNENESDGYSAGLPIVNSAKIEAHPNPVPTGAAPPPLAQPGLAAPNLRFDNRVGDHPFGDAEGRGPGEGGDRYDRIYENRFLRVTDNPLSTFSIDVDTASYSKVRMYLQRSRLPRPDAVRIEELINYFTYDYQPPADDAPFAARVEVTQCPWAPKHRLARIGIKGKEIAAAKRPFSNLVFLLDVSGSMESPNKLPLLRRGMKMLVDQLGENDRVAIVVYAGAAGVVLDSTTADHKDVILAALDRLRAGGSTNGGQGIQLAYQVALDHYIEGGVNRVILCTDGDFNVGTTGTDSLVRLAETNAKTGTFLTVLGFGMGNHNDAMMEQLSNKGNGNYAFIDTENEARKVLVEQISSTLVTIAKDVKIQVEFNPQEVAAFRLIGYENRILAAEDFNDDKKDAGEIGAGHTVTALYEIIPVGVKSEALGSVDELKYQKKTKPADAANGGELLTVKLRYKQPDGDTSKLLQFPVKDDGKRFGQADQDFRFAASVAQFGMLLRNSQFKGDSNYAALLEIATEAAAGDKSGYRQEFLELVKIAKQLKGE